MNGRTGGDDVGASRGIITIENRINKDSIGVGNISDGIESGTTTSRIGNGDGITNKEILVRSGGGDSGTSVNFDHRIASGISAIETGEIGKLGRRKLIFEVIDRGRFDWRKEFGRDEKGGETDGKNTGEN